MSSSDVLVGDVDRQQAIARLRQACGDGRLTLDEFSDRAAAVFAARTAGQLDLITRDLPPGAVSRPRPPVHWTVSILSDVKRKGRWRIVGQTNVLTMLGSCTLDLRHANVAGDEIAIHVHVLMGSVKIVVPRGSEVDVGGLVILGSNDSKVRSEDARAGAPFVRVHGLIVMGSVDVVSD